jgi:hypothetical protein
MPCIATANTDWICCIIKGSTYHHSISNLTVMLALLERNLAQVVSWDQLCMMMLHPYDSITYLPINVLP